MTVRSICLFAGMLCLVGCGTAEQHAASTATSVQPNAEQKKSEQANIEQTSPAKPPGTMQLPADAVIPNPKASPTSADPLAGGFELPPLDAATAGATSGKPNETVKAQRPILDEPQASTVDLQAATLDEAMRYAHTVGKVCVVDFWSLGCGPCLKEFPGLVALHKKYGDRLACMSVNCDYDGRKTKPAEHYRERAEAFLNANHAAFKNFLCTTPNEEVYAKLKTVSIPVVLVLGADGKVVKMFTDSGETLGFTYTKDVSPLVDSLLDESPTN